MTMPRNSTKRKIITIYADTILELEIGLQLGIGTDCRRKKCQEAFGSLEKLFESVRDAWLDLRAELGKKEKPAGKRWRLNCITLFTDESRLMDRARAGNPI